MVAQIKYQVFVSSTYEDLTDEREQVIRAILEMGHIPVGMEMFSAADEEQWRIIARHIDSSDYYVVIAAHRYGSMDGDISYTEKEYDYAVAQRVPVLGFVIDTAARWPSNRIEQDEHRRQLLARFKGKIKLKPVGFWTNSDDLYGKVSIALNKLITGTPRPGWARADTMIGPEVTAELSRLSSENNSLRQELERHSRTASVAAKSAEIIDILARNVRVFPLRQKGRSDYERRAPITLLWFFEKIAPQLVVEQPLREIGNFIAVMRRDKIRKSQLNPTWPVPKNYLQGWLADLLTLDLVEPSKKRHAVSDKDEYWTLTDNGRQVLAYLRRANLERGEAAHSSTGVEKSGDMAAVDPSEPPPAELSRE